jgi:hypothetical protein
MARLRDRRLRRCPGGRPALRRPCLKDHLTVLVARVRLLARIQTAAGPQEVA